MPLYTFNPLQDDRWVEYLDDHPQSSIFHTRGWLEALHRTYGYEPLVFTTTPPGRPLANGLVFSRIKSWLTGPRLVSLAFSDHCQPLVSGPDQLPSLVGLLPRTLSRCNCRYIELRPICTGPVDFESVSDFKKSASFHFHKLDLRPDLDSLYRGLHKSCVQRKIRRADREGLTYQEGRSDELLRHFYSLMILTRKRHGIVPQPFSWFRNLALCLRDALKVRVVFRHAEPVASIMTLHHKKCTTYKYGASNAQFHKLGSVPLLFWKTIQDAKSLQAEEFDLGRSDGDNQGLIEFKDRLGAQSVGLDYYRHPPSKANKRYRKTGYVLSLGAHAPTFLRRAAGRLLYRHIA